MVKKIYDDGNIIKHYYLNKLNTEDEQKSIMNENEAAKMMRLGKILEISVITLWSRCGILMSMIVVMMTIWIGVCGIVVTFQDISIWC